MGTPPLRLSCILTPGPNVVEHARVAEALGYRRVWVNDSPALFPDVWMVLDRIAAATTRIGVGPAVVVPRVRHVVAVAAAARTLCAAAPGRLAITIGTGFTAAITLGLRPNRWADTTRFVRQLRGLLGGERVPGDDSALLGLGGLHARTPVNERIPLLVAADGPIGRRHAHAVADGLFCDGIFGADSWEDGFGVRVLAVHGTVLDEGERLEDDRVRQAVGPAVAMRVRYLWLLRASAEVTRVPGGEEWLSAVERIPAEVRHLELFGGYFTSQSSLDAPIINAATIGRFTLTGPAGEVAEELSRLHGAGATEIAFRPGGADVPRELSAFASAARLVEGG